MSKKKSAPLPVKKKKKIIRDNESAERDTRLIEPVDSWRPPPVPSEKPSEKPKKD